MMFCAAMALTTSAGDSPLACSAAGPDPPGSAAACRRRGYGVCAPSMVASWMRMVLVARSFSCCSFSPGPERPSCRMGTLEALY